MMNQHGARNEQNRTAATKDQEIIDTAPQLPRRQLSHSSISLSHQDHMDSQPKRPPRQSNFQHAGNINRNSIRRWAPVLDHSSTGSVSSGPPLSSVLVPSDSSVWSTDVSTLKSQDDDPTVNVPPSVIEDEEMGSPVLFSSGRSWLGSPIHDSTPGSNAMQANARLVFTDRRMLPSECISPTSPPASGSPGRPLPEQNKVPPPPMPDRFLSPSNRHPGNVAPPLPSRTPSDDGSIEFFTRTGISIQPEIHVAPPPFGQSLETISSHSPALGSTSTTRNDKNCGRQEVMIEVTPGTSMPLRGTDETWTAIELGHSTVTFCISCQQELTCLVDAELVACPDCPDCLSPVVQTSDESEDCRRYGVGIGVKLEDVRRWYERQG